MKRLSIIATTALLLTGLMATPAHADVASDQMAERQTEAWAVADYWLENGAANLASATPYGEQVPGGLSQGDAFPTGSPHTVSPLVVDGKGKLPTSVGKVYFVAADGLPHWCTGTSMQSKYRNLVATAGQCALDPGSGALRNWVFLPGAASDVLYVGKMVTSHYDYATYDDSDFNYAFVTVYNGLSLSPDGTRVDRGRLGDNAGGQGFASGQVMGGRVDAFGYPAGLNPDGKQPYPGDSLEVATGTTAGPVGVPSLKAGHLVTAGSDFTGEGGVGSPWLAGYDGDRRAGFLAGITISVADTDGNLRYDTSLSAYFDSDAAEVYTAASNVWSGAIA